MPVIDEVAGLLPAENITRGVAPRRTAVIPFSRQKLEVSVAVIKIPISSFSHLKNFLKKSGHLGAMEEKIVIR